MGDGRINWKRWEEGGLGSLNSGYKWYLAYFDSDAGTGRDYARALPSFEAKRRDGADFRCTVFTAAECANS
jgi:hypothetical protein